MPEPLPTLLLVARSRKAEDSAPLFPTVPIDHVVPDLLHLFLRVTDVLFNLLILDIRRQDGIEQCAQSGSSGTSPGLSKLESFLADTCKVPFKFSICKETKHLQWRDLMGPEKLVLFEKANLIVLFPLILRLKPIFLVSVLSNGFETSLVSIKPSMTPYIHLMAMNIPEFLKLYGNLVQFTQQGMEN